MNADLFFGILDSVEKAIHYAKLGKSQMKILILTGGHTPIRMYNISNAYKGLQWQWQTIDTTINPCGAIVHDTSARTLILSRAKSDHVQDLLLLATTTFSIGIATPGRIKITMINIISTCPKSRQTCTTYSDNHLKVLLSLIKVDAPCNLLETIKSYCIA